MSSVAFALALMLSGCGGGGGSSSSSSVTPPVGQTGTERLTLTIPAKSPSLDKRSPRYISSLTQSVTITVQGGTSITFPLTPSSPGCTPGSAGLTCVITFPVPVGNTTVQFATFASTDGSGTPLSVATIPVTVTASQVNDVTVTLNGVVKTIALSVTPAQVVAGTASTVNVVVSATDASGAIVAGPGNYSDAQGNTLTLTLSDSDTTGATHLSQTTFTAPPSAAATLSYNGAAIPDVTLTLSAPGVTSATALLHVNPANTQPLYVATRNNTCASQPDAGDVWNYATLASAGGGVGQLNSKLKLSAPRAVAFAVDRVGYEDVLTNPDPTFGGANAIVRYAQGQSGDGSVPASLIQGSSTLLDNAVAIAADSAGGVWVAQPSPTTGQPGTLLHFAGGAGGNVAPDRQITAIGGMDPTLRFAGTSVAVDSHDHIYTIVYTTTFPNSSKLGGYVYELAANSNGTATALATYPFYFANGSVSAEHLPTGVSVDQHTDAVWAYPVDVFTGDVNSASGASPVGYGAERFPHGNPTEDRVLYGEGAFPSTTPSGYDIAGAVLTSMAFDDAGNVYVQYAFSNRSNGGCLQTRVSSFGSAQHGATTAATNTQIGAQDSPIGIAIPYSTAPASSSSSTTHAGSVVVPSPSSMSFVATGPSYAQPLHATENGYTGTFTAVSSNTAVATVQPSSSSGSFTVTSVGAGNATITLVDASGNAAGVAVSSSITAFHLQSVRR